MRTPLLFLTTAVLLSAPWPGVKAGNWELMPELTPEALADKRLLNACDMGDSKVVDSMLVNRPKKANSAEAKQAMADVEFARNEFGQSPLVLARLGRHGKVERTVLAALRRKPSWRSPMTHAQLADWIQQHSGPLEWLVTSGVADSLEFVDVRKRFPELPDHAVEQVLKYAQRERRLYTQRYGEDGPVVGTEPPLMR